MHLNFEFTKILKPVMMGMSMIEQAKLIFLLSMQFFLGGGGLVWSFSFGWSCYSFASFGNLCKFQHFSIPCPAFYILKMKWILSHFSQSMNVYPKFCFFFLSMEWKGPWIVHCLNVFGIISVDGIDQFFFYYVAFWNTVDTFLFLSLSLPGKPWKLKTVLGRIKNVNECKHTHTDTRIKIGKTNGKGNGVCVHNDR